uniref:Uncharacterized protein n=1 Tax=Caenorhabditis japonica TaxID=281687 RepID=A0A8R1DWR1_CAEJA
MTRNLLAHAASKVIIHSRLRRELIRRTQQQPSQSLRRFLSKTTGLVSQSTNWKSIIPNLPPTEYIFDSQSQKAFAVLNIGVGKLCSTYASEATKNDMFFAESPEGKGCFRFVAVIVDAHQARILAEPVKPAQLDQHYHSFQTAVESLNDTYLHYGIVFSIDLRHENAVRFR